MEEALAVIRFGGVSLTDFNGSPLSSPDPDDWRMNADWNSYEERLFEGAAKSLCNDQGEAFARVFPNPASGQAALTLGNMKKAARAEMRIVDRNYRILRSFGPLDLNNGSEHSLVLDVSELGMENDTIRLYYRLDFGNCELRGFGDIIIR